MKLQLAFDFLEVPDIARMIERVGDLIDVVEIGTPVIIRDGIAAVRRIRQAFPALEILADLKIIDGGRYEASLAFEAGADSVTVLALADNITVAAALKAAREHPGSIVADLIGVRDIRRRASELEELGVDCVCVHTAIDVQGTGRNPLEELRAVKAVLQRACSAVAGGIDSGTIAQTARENPDIVIVGSGITREADPRAAALEIRRWLHP